MSKILGPTPSNESLTAMKRTILHEIERLDRKIIYISKLKDAAVTNLARQKSVFNKQEILGEDEHIDDEIAMLHTQHVAVLERQSKIHEAKEEFVHLEEMLAEINNELMGIQERHDQVMGQLTEKKEFLQDRLASIEAMDNMQVQLETDMKEEMFAYEDELTRLKRERNELLNRTDMTASEMELALQDIDSRIENLESSHMLQMSKLEQAYSCLQVEMSRTYSPARKQEVLDELERLKIQALTASPSELILIEKRMEELTKELEQIQTMLDLQAQDSTERLSFALAERGLHLTPSGRIVTETGLILTIEEALQQGLLEGLEDEISRMRERQKLNQLLVERGLQMTNSGRLQTLTGEVYTMKEACKLGLLRGLEQELMKMRGITLTASGRIQTADGKVLTRVEATRVGLLEGICLDELFADESETVSVTTSTATSISGMSTSDVHYLKNVLGRPLALALAEITAKQPRDPIHYLGHWLYKYRYNQEVDETKKKELEELVEERDRLARIALREQAEIDARSVLIDLLGRVDEEVARNAIEAELRRIEEDQAIEAEEEAELEAEARDTLGVYAGPTKGQQLT